MRVLYDVDTEKKDAGEKAGYLRSLVIALQDDSESLKMLLQFSEQLVEVFRYQDEALCGSTSDFLTYRQMALDCIDNANKIADNINGFSANEEPSTNRILQTKHIHAFYFEKPEKK